MAARNRGRISAIRALYFPAYRYFWFSALFNSGAIQMQQLARSYLARDLTPEPIIVTSVFALGTLPMLFTPLVGGVLADRMDRKRLNLALDMVQAALVLGIAVLQAAGIMNIPILMLFSVASGTVMGLSLPIRQAMIPDVVEPDAATNGLVLFSGVFSMMTIVAPAVAGILIGAASIEVALYASMGLFAVSVPLFLKVPGGTAHVRQEREPFMETIQGGFRYVRRSRALMLLMVSGTLATVCYIPYMSLLPIFQRDVFERDASALGLMFTASGAGALGSAVLLALFSSERPRVAVMLAMAIVTGLFIAGFAHAPSLGVGLGALVFVGLFQSGSMTLNMALVQYLAPGDMRGRVLAIRMIVWGMIPFGQVLVGLGAQATSPEAALATLGLAGSVLQVVLLFWFRRTPMEPEETGEEEVGTGVRMRESREAVPG